MLDNRTCSAYEAVRETGSSNLPAKGDFGTRLAQGAARRIHRGNGFPAEDGLRQRSGDPCPAAAAADRWTVRGHLPSRLRTIYDGRYANVGWLQELPKPITNLSWDNAAHDEHTHTLSKLGWPSTTSLRSSSNGSKVMAPVFAVPGHPDEPSPLTWAMAAATRGRVGSGMGFNAYAIRTSGAPLFARATMTKTGDTYEFAVTKSHYTDHRASLAGGDGCGDHSSKATRRSTAASSATPRSTSSSRIPNFAHERRWSATIPKPTTSMFPNWRYDKNAWGMAIDMNSCVGCNACIVSCYAENNIAVVGKHRYKIGRDMQWIRIDTYFEGDLDAPRAHFQPMTCQHCENAPCEQVCPVGATVHSPEGLNIMVYNRCVGTRYCSNNCPYKVRRFNFLLFSDYETESLKLMRNPE